MNRDDRKSGALARTVIEQRLWGESPFFLLDVGCSGGLDRRWQVLGELLHAVGFDPLLAEVERLNLGETRPHVTYEAGFLTGHDFEALFPSTLRADPVASRSNDSFQRSSAAAAQRRLDVSYVQQEFNAGAPVVLSDRRLVLDEYLAAGRYADIDFLKIDTDGHDLEVLLGATAIMAAGGVLALQVEVQFHGAVHPYANTFSNIDRLLRGRGFTLFDLDVYRYSRAELPAPFAFDLAAQTISGPVAAGDALYCRDLGSSDYAKMWPYDITAARVLKLACVFDLFGLPDCAAELLVNQGGLLPAGERDHLLDLLATGEPGSYRAHLAAFDHDFTSFYPSRRRDAPPVGGNDDGAAKQVRRLRERISDLGGKNAELRGRLKARGERIRQLTKRLEKS